MVGYLSCLFSLTYLLTTHKTNNSFIVCSSHSFYVLLPFFFFIYGDGKPLESVFFSNFLIFNFAFWRYLTSPTKKKKSSYLPCYLPTYQLARVHRPVIPGALCDTRRRSRPGRETKTRKTTTQGAAEEASYSACFLSNRPSRSPPPWLLSLPLALQLSLLLWDVRKWNSALYRARSEPLGS